MPTSNRSCAGTGDPVTYHATGQVSTCNATPIRGPGQVALEPPGSQGAAAPRAAGLPPPVVLSWLGPASAPCDPAASNATGQWLRRHQKLRGTPGPGQGQRRTSPAAGSSERSCAMPRPPRPPRSLVACRDAACFACRLRALPATSHPAIALLLAASHRQSSCWHTLSGACFWS